MRAHGADYKMQSRPKSGGCVSMDYGREPRRQNGGAGITQSSIMALGGCAADSYINSGLALPLMTFSSMTTLLTCSADGISYMVSSSTLSRIERRPRAPVLRVKASCAIAFRATVLNSHASSSISDSQPYWMVSEYFCSVSNCISASSTSSVRDAITYRRQTYTRIRTNLTRSHRSTSSMVSLTLSPTYLLRT